MGEEISQKETLSATGSFILLSFFAAIQIQLPGEEYKPLLPDVLLLAQRPVWGVFSRRDQGLSAIKIYAFTRKCVDRGIESGMI